MLCSAHQTSNSQRGRTPLQCAAHAGYDETVEHLIRLGADIHAEIEVREGASGYHWWPPSSSLGLLLFGGRQETGDTALHLATQRGFGDVASLLVDAGADLKRPNKVRADQGPHSSLHAHMHTHTYRAYTHTRTHTRLRSHSHSHSHSRGRGERPGLQSTIPWQTTLRSLKRLQR